MSTLEIVDVVKQLGDNTVVKGVTFRVEEGEFFVLLGASGSGKSTLLRLICGLETPDAGQIIIAGEDVTRVPPRDRNIGMVFQDYGLYPNMNVYQNIAYGLEARGVARQTIEERVPKAAQMLGLGAMLERSIVDLSGGEQQRVALARALAKDANAYLFDEPLSNLDPKLRHQARRDILNLHRQKRKPSLYVTHDQNEAFAMADRIGIIADGILQQVGSVEDILRHPANLFVARFIGTPPMNLLRGDLVRADSTYKLQTQSLSLTLPQRWSDRLARYGKEQVVFGVRPEALTPVNGAAGEPPDGRVIDVQIETVEMLIGEMEVTFQIGPERLAAVFQDDGHLELSPGKSLRLAIDFERACLFDPDTETALPVV